MLAPRIFIFSIVLGAEDLSYAKSIATFALTFFGYIISVLASVITACVEKTSYVRPNHLLLRPFFNSF